MSAPSPTSGGTSVPSMSIEDFPRYPLTFGPSPVHQLKRLSDHLGGARIWAKREDCNSGLAYGGNKTRKLEYLVPEALAQGADTLVSIGGVPVQPHPPGRGRGRAPRHELRAGAGEVGRLARLRQRPRRQHHAQPDHGRRGAARPGRLRHRLQATRGSRRLDDVEERGGTPYAIPAGASRPPARRARVSPTGPTRSPSRSSELGRLLRHRSWSARSPARRTPG